MGFAVVSQVNQAYNQEVEGLSGDDIARRGLSQGNQSDLAAKAFQPWRDPQFKHVVTTTTATDTGSTTLNMATSTRTVNDPAASPSNPLTKLLGPIAGLLTAGVTRTIRVRTKQVVSATVTNVFWTMFTVLGGTTPVVFGPVLNTAASAQLGSKRAVDDQVTLTAGVGSLVLTVTHGTGNAALTWNLDVFVDDPI